MHLDDDRIQRLIDGELAPEDRETAQAHLEACDGCRALVRAAESDEAEVLDLLGALDGPPATASLARVIDEASRGGARSRPGGAAIRWAAGVTIALGAAGAAYALPGSPLRDWLAARLGDPEPAQAGQAAVSDAGPGISIVPGEGLVVELAGPDGPPDVTVLLVDTEEVTVRARIGPASFETDAGRVRALSGGPAAAIDVEIPKNASRVELVRGGRTVFLVEGGAVRTSATPDADGRYHLPAGG